MERPLSGCRAMEPSRQTFAHYIEGIDLCAHWRNRRRGDNLLARAPRRRSQLGLSLLLAKGRDLHAPGIHASRVLRRSAGLARLARPRRRRQSRAGPDRVRRRRRALATGIDRAVAQRLRMAWVAFDRAADAVGAEASGD